MTPWIPPKIVREASVIGRILERDVKAEKVAAHAWRLRIESDRVQLDLRLKVTSGNRLVPSRKGTGLWIDGEQRKLPPSFAIANGEESWKEFKKILDDPTGFLASLEPAAPVSDMPPAVTDLSGAPAVLQMLAKSLDHSSFKDYVLVEIGSTGPMWALQVTDMEGDDAQSLRIVFEFGNGQWYMHAPILSQDGKRMDAADLTERMAHILETFKRLHPSMAPPSGVGGAGSASPVKGSLATPGGVRSKTSIHRQ